MTKTYFENVNTLEELRKQYKKLIKMYHPDNAFGSDEDMKAINTEYERLFKILKDKHTQETEETEAAGGYQSTYSKNMYNFEDDSALREMLIRIINFDCDIEIIGSWIWVFNSFSYRKELKELGFKYASNKKAWYFHTEAFRKSSNKKLSLDDIRSYYGTTKIKEDKRLLEA